VEKLKKYLINLTREAVVSEFGVKESVLDIFLPSSIYKLILVGINRGNSGLRRISSISFFKDLIIL